MDLLNSKRKFLACALFPESCENTVGVCVVGVGYWERKPGGRGGQGPVEEGREILFAQKYVQRTVSRTNGMNFIIYCPNAYEDYRNVQKQTRKTCYL